MSVQQPPNQHGNGGFSSLVPAQASLASGSTNDRPQQPSIMPRHVDIQAVAARLLDQNRNLFEDNRRLVLKIKDAHTKQKNMEQFYQQREQFLEQQVVMLQRENLEILARERNREVGHQEYAQCQEECLRLRNECAQLKQHIIGLQTHVPFPPTSNSTLIQPSSHRVLMSGQPAQARIVQGPLRRQRDLASRRNLPSLTQTRQNNQRDRYSPVQDTLYHKPPNKPVLPSFVDTRQLDLTRSTISASPRLASSSFQGSAEINAQGFWMADPSPVTQGPANGTSSADTYPAALMTPSDLLRRQISDPLPQIRLQSRPHLLPANLPHPQPQIRTQPNHPDSASSSAIVSPTVPDFIPKDRVSNIMKSSTSTGVPFINAPQGAPTFAVGPPQKCVSPPIAYTKAHSTSSSTLGLGSGPATRPTTVEGSPTSISDHSVIPSKFYRRSLFTTGVLPGLQTQSPTDLTPNTSNPSNFRSPMQTNSDEHLHTPRLTPLSSRGSVGLSEGVSEVMTPLDAVSRNTINVTESPTVGEQVIVQKICPEDMVDMDAGDEADVQLLDLVQKRPQLDNANEHILPDRQASATAPTPAVISATASNPIPASPATAVLDVSKQSEIPDMKNDGDDDDDDDDDEIGPDGMRSIRSCLEIFTEEDEDGVYTCSLCISRHCQGLIAKPVSFASDATREEKVQHFLDEHPTSWDKLVHGTIIPVPG